MQVGDTQDEWLIAFVRAAVKEAGCLGVGASNDDAGHLHDIELEASCVEPLHLLVLGNENLAALMAALLNSGLLIFDVIARDAHLNEAADQVAHMCVAAVTGVGVGNNEGPEVEFRTLLTLFRRHA